MVLDPGSPVRPSGRRGSPVGGGEAMRRADHGVGRRRDADKVVRFLTKNLFRFFEVKEEPFK